MKPHRLSAGMRPHFSVSSIRIAFLILASRSALRASSVVPVSRAFSLSSNSLCCLTLIILPKRGDELIILDQHGAHERILCERLLKNPKGTLVAPPSPVVVRLPEDL